MQQVVKKQDQDTPRSHGISVTNPSMRSGKVSAVESAEHVKETVRLSAFKFRDLGLRVFPTCTPVFRDGACVGCDCAFHHAPCHSPGKIPAIKWRESPIPSDEQLSKWLRKRPLTNLAVNLTDTGVFALDVDCKHGSPGFSSLASLEETLGALPPTFTVRTGSGGVHLYFKQPEGFLVKTNSGVLAPGLDLRGQGGYGVTAPSLHTSGMRYVIEKDLPFATLPPAWQAHMKTQGSTGSEKGYVRGSVTGWHFYDVSNAPIPAKMEALVTRFVRKSDQVGRNTAGTSLAWALAQHMDTVFSFDDCVRAMRQYQCLVERQKSDAYTIQEAENSLKSALEKHVRRLSRIKGKENKTLLSVDDIAQNTADVKTLFLVQKQSWQDRSVTPVQQEKRLRQATSNLLADATMEVQRNVANGISARIVVATPPGSGKSYVFPRFHAQVLVRHKDGTETFREAKVAWIAQNHAIAQENAQFEENGFTRLMPCTKENCENWEYHQRLLLAGMSTDAAHRDHLCAYKRQFIDAQRMVCQLQHIPAAFMKTFDVIIVDEFDPATWIKRHVFPVATLESTIATLPQLGVNEFQRVCAERLLLACMRTCTRIRDTYALAGSPVSMQYGRVLFDALDKELQGQLGTIIQSLLFLGNDRRPSYDGDLADMPAALPKVVLPHIIYALATEYRYWVDSTVPQWNSALAVEYVTDKSALVFSEKVALPSHAHHIIMDATYDKGVFDMFFDQQPFRVLTDHVPVMPSTEVYQWGERYPKTKMIAGTPFFEKAILDAQTLLQSACVFESEIRAGKVGLITYQQCEQALGEALGIPAEKRLHFFNARGKNTLSSCDVLLLVGSPIVPVETAIEILRVILPGSDKAIDPTYDASTGCYKDARLQNFMHYKLLSEVEQGAHRVRPLRNDHRCILVLSMCDIPNLPPTRRYMRLVPESPEEMLG